MYFVGFPGFVDSVSIHNRKELQHVVKFWKKFQVTEKLWTSGTCCNRDGELLHRWTFGETIESELRMDQQIDRDNLCNFFALNIKEKRLQHESEEKDCPVLCELRIAENLEITSMPEDNTERTDGVESTIPEGNYTIINASLETIEDRTTTVSVITPKSVIFCNEETIGNISWPQTGAGDTANVSNCPEGTVGNVTLYCDKNGSWDKEGPKMDNCISRWIQDIKDEIAHKKDPLKIAQVLSDSSKNKLQCGDLKVLMETIASLQDHFRDKEIASTQLQSKEFGDALLKTGSNMLNDNQKLGWENLPLENRRKTANTLIKNMETIGKILTCGGANVEAQTIVKDNIALQSFVFHDKSDMIFPSSRDIMNTSTFITLPGSLSNQNFATCHHHSHQIGYGIIYKKIALFLTGDDQKHKINSKIIGFNYGASEDSINLPEGSHVTITLQHLRPGLFGATCVFWNAETLEWNSTGCKTINSNETHTECACSHLTNFAVLMDFSGQIGSEDNAIMSYLTYVCSSLSIVSLIITIACLQGFRAVHSRRSTITCNLCYCLLIVNLIVVFGLKRTEERVVCSIIAGLLHYVATASFVWMLLEGYHLYQMVIVVFHKIDTIKFRWLYLFGYGSPLLIVATSAAISPGSYGRGNFCWISYENGFTWSFAGPAAAIILANTVVLIMALRSASNVKMKKDKSRIRNVLGWLKGSFSLMSLLGITWVFGFVYASKTTLSFAYVFITFNGLQGVFLMIFHVVLNEKVRQCFRNFITRKKVSHRVFISSLRTTTSQNPLHSQSFQPSKTSYLSSPRRSSITPVNHVFTRHI